MEIPTAMIANLEERRRTNKTLVRIDNASLVAGEPMYFYCTSCGEPIVLPEDYLPPRPKLCPECTLLKSMGMAL